MRPCGPLPVASLLVLLVLVTHGDAIKCSICDTERDGIRCILAPPEPIDCEDMVEYCTIVTKYNSRDQLETLTRTCMPIFFPDSCRRGIDRRDGNKPVTLCTRTCGKTGCNMRPKDPFLLKLLDRK